MSNDPKKPLDPAPNETPDILQKDLNLDRRNRRGPTFEELKAPASVTQPGIPGPFARTTPVGTVMPGSPTKQPSTFDVAPTSMRPHVTAAPAQHTPEQQVTRAPVNQMPAPPGLTPKAAPKAPPAQPRQPAPQERTALARPHAPPQQQQPTLAVPPPAPPATGRAPAHGAHDATRAHVMPRQAPPSPTDWATRAVPPPTADAPTVPVQPIRVTAAAPTRGASLPSGHYSKGSYAQPHVPVAAPVPTAPEPEFVTAPDRRAAQRPAPVPQPPITAPEAMPHHLRVTQPEMRNPFLAQQAAPVAATPETMAAPPPQGPTRVIEPHAPAAKAVPAPTATPPEPLLTPDFGEVPVFEAEAAEPGESIDEASPSDVVATPASLWRRSFAWVFDLAIIALVVSGFFAAALAVIGKPSAALLLSVAIPAAGVVGFVAFVYTTLFAFLFSGRTPGRRILGIHLVDSSGHAPRVGRALVRAVLSLASFALCLAGFWLALFDRRGQTLHDKLTSTFVVRLKPAV